MRILPTVFCLAIAALVPVHNGCARPIATTHATLADEACDFDIAEDYVNRVSCHRLFVPRNYADPSQGTFGLAMVRVRAQTAVPGRAPLLLLHGGPGGRGITSSMGRARPEFDPGADLIAFDQRGNGRSEPRICDDIPSETITAIVAPGDLLTMAWRLNEPYMRCRTRFEQAGVSPEHFGTGITTEDVEQLRLALGVERWNLMAVSYGTVVALDLMAAHPHSVGTVVMDSLVGHNVAIDAAEYDRPLREVFSRCAADSGCAREYPSLAADYEGAVASFNQSPLVVTAGEGGTLPRELDINGGDLQFLLRRLMRNLQNIASIPPLIRAAKERDVDTLRPLLGKALDALPEPNSLGRPAIMCRDVPYYRGVDAPTHGMEAFRLLGVCAAWGPPGPAARIASGTKSPVLIMMGALDPLFEPEVVRQVSRGLGARAEVVMFPNRTHGIWRPGCAQQIVATFFATAATPDTSCSDSDSKIQFIAPPARSLQVPQVLKFPLHQADAASRVGSTQALDAR